MKMYEILSPDMLEFTYYTTFATIIKLRFSFLTLQISNAEYRNTHYH